MALYLGNYEAAIRRAVKLFWTGREAARVRQQSAGKTDQGERAAVTAGQNMNGFIDLISDIVRGNGLKSAEIHLQRRLLTLPGFFRPAKLWDMLVMHDGKLIAALEFKSQVGPSFGNNSNNRAEEAIGNAHDFWTAYRESAFGQAPRPFLGWLMLVEDAPASRQPVKDHSPHFAVFPEFRNVSYLERYRLLCGKLMQEQLYTAACVLASPRSGARGGEHSSLDELSGASNFLATFAGHIAAEACRKG